MRSGMINSILEKNEKNKKRKNFTKFEFSTFFDITDPFLLWISVTIFTWFFSFIKVQLKDWFFNRIFFAFPKFCSSYVFGLKQGLFCFSRECEENYSSISGNWINNAEAIKPLFMRLNWQNEKSGISLYYTSKHNKPLFRGF